MHALDLQDARWRKSTRSTAQANCVEIAHLWRKSSRSGDQANCVEVAFSTLAVAVRDSKNTDGPVLTFPAANWTTFLR